MNLRKGFWSSFRKGAVFRGLLTLVALLYVTQHLSAVAHFALVQHAICNEHGELVDVDASASAPLASEDASASELASEKSSSHSGHEHCGVLAHFRPHLSAPVFAGIPLRVAATPDIAIAACPSSPPPAIPGYWLAPKNSPPA